MKLFVNMMKYDLGRAVGSPSPTIMHEAVSRLKETSKGFAKLD